MRGSKIPADRGILPAVAEKKDKTPLIRSYLQFRSGHEAFTRLYLSIGLSYSRPVVTLTGAHGSRAPCTVNNLSKKVCLAVRNPPTPTKPPIAQLFQPSANCIVNAKLKYMIYSPSGLIPTATMEHAQTTFNFKSVAFSINSSLSLPGLSQSSLQPFFATSSSTFNPSAGGR